MTPTGRTFLLFSNAGTGAESGAGTQAGASASYSPQLALDTDEDALLQISAEDGTPTFNMFIQGRLRPDLPWTDLIPVVTQAALTSNDSLLIPCPLAPYMRVFVSANTDTTAGNLTVYVLN